MEFREVHEFDDGLSVEVYDGSSSDLYYRVCEAYGAAWQAKHSTTSTHLCVLPKAITDLQPTLVGVIRMVDRGPLAGQWGWYPGAGTPDAVPAFTDPNLSPVRVRVAAELTPRTAGRPDRCPTARRLYP